LNAIFKRDKFIFFHKTQNLIMLHRFFIPLILLCFFYISKGQEQPIKEYLDYYFYKCPKDSAKFYRMATYDKYGVYHGNIKTYYMSGKIYSDIEFYHGVKEGRWTWWHENGNKSLEADYDNNSYYLKNSWSKDGTPQVVNGDGYCTSTWHLSDQISSYGKYVNGVSDSLWIWWYENGKLEETSLYENGEVIVKEIYDDKGNSQVKEGTGSFTTYYNKTKVRTRGAYKNGKKEGDWKWYHRYGEYFNEVASYKEGNLHGENIVWYENGNKKFEGVYEDGDLEGKAKWYYWDGQLDEEGVYKNGKYSISNSWDINGKPMVVDGNGNYEAYYANGKIKCRGVYKNSLREGIWVWYYKSNGQKKEETDYKKGEYFVLNYWQEDGKQTMTGGTGYMIKYFACGGINVRAVYKNQKRDGEWTWYHENGKKKETVNYSEGTLTGKNITWNYKGEKKREKDIDPEKKTKNEIDFYDNGQAKEEGVYLDGKYKITNYWTREGVKIVSNGTGELVTYHDNGKVKARGIYKNSNKVGKWQWWHDNGQLKSQETYVDGKLQGKTASYFENGIKKVEGTYKEDERNGKFTWYNEDGTKSSIDIYKNGQKHGLCSYYKDGKKTSESYFEEGKKIYSIIKYFSDGEPLYEIVDKRPEPMEGFLYLNKIVEEKVIDINEDKIKYSEDGVIHVGFLINKNGELIQPSVMKGSINSYYDKQAIDLVKDYFSKWKPGTLKGKPVSCLVTVPVLFRKSDRLKNTFEVSLSQSGRGVVISNNTASIDRNSFQINVKFPKPNENGVELIATFDSVMYRKALQGIPIIQLIGEESGMADDYGNPSNKLTITSHAASYWYYTDSTENRFNNSTDFSAYILCNRIIDSLTTLSYFGEADKVTAIKESKHKDLYLIFFNRKNYYDDSYYMDYYRQCIHVRIKQ
jgi:antitoxin component YwqK of YwqJK toxin-antitoxin module